MEGILRKPIFLWYQMPCKNHVAAAGASGSGGVAAAWYFLFFVYMACITKIGLSPPCPTPIPSLVFEHVLLDLVMAYQMAYKQMVGLGVKTHSGTRLGDVNSFADRFYTYARGFQHVDFTHATMLDFEIHPTNCIDHFGTIPD